MERLDKLISSRLGISRKDTKEIIRLGKASLNGQPARSGEQKCGPADTLMVDGRRLGLSEHCYLMLNKPRDVVCATRDNSSRTVLDLLPDDLRRKGLFPAGRLDKDTEGFVLITDDGDFAHRILSPKKHVPKTYLARLDAPVDVPLLTQAFAEGVALGEDRAGPAQLRLVEDGAQPLLELVIYEGIFHQVKRMFALFSRDVIHLRRIRIGGLTLDPALSPGGCRALGPQELALISGSPPG